MKATIRESTMGNHKYDDTNGTNNDTKITVYHISVAIESVSAVKMVNSSTRSSLFESNLIILTCNVIFNAEEWQNWCEGPNV